jgi:hypothetical protein
MEIADPRVHPGLVPHGTRANIVNGKDREYRDLPCLITPKNQVITRWTPTEEERIKLFEGEDVYVTIIANRGINPFFVTVGPVNWAKAEKG